jgi:hypothetical protein
LGISPASPRTIAAALCSICISTWASCITNAATYADTSQPNCARRDVTPNSRIWRRDDSAATVWPRLKTVARPYVYHSYLLTMTENAPAVSLRNWIWWADGPCHKNITHQSFTAPTSQESEEISTAPTSRDNILTSIKPVDVTSMTPSSRSLWELKNVFNHIYTTIQRIMRLWIEPCWRPVVNACFWSTVAESGGDPRVSYESCRNDVHITQAHVAITLKYGEPYELFTTCAQWYKYVAMTNALSRIQSTVREYEYMRSRMSRPDEYIRVHMTELFPSIDRDRYLLNQTECFDYERVVNPISTYPWPI